MELNVHVFFIFYLAHFPISLGIDVELETENMKTVYKPTSQKKNNNDINNNNNNNNNKKRKAKTTY